MRIVTYKCDRCKKEIKKFSDIKMITLLKKTQEFCKDCAEDFKRWYSQKKGKEKGK